MWQLPVLIGLLTAGAAFGSATRRKAFPADIAGMVRSGLQSKNDSQLSAILQQLNAHYPRQVKLIFGAWGATHAHDGSLNVPADIDAMYANAFHSGDPLQMVATAKALDNKYHYLSKHLDDLASLLGNLVSSASAATAASSSVPISSAAAPTVPSLAPAPFPADVAGTVRSSLKMNNDAQLQATLAAIAASYPQQVAYISAAWTASKMPDGTLAVPAEIAGTYQAAFHSGTAATMRATASALQSSYPTLATALNGVASLLQNAG